MIHFESTEPTAHSSSGDLPLYREHSLLEQAVTEAARELQVSREMALMCAFGAMSTACQRLVDVEMPTGHRVPASLMLLTIAESGERKTTTQNYFFDSINSLNDEEHRINEQNLVEHRLAHQLWATETRRLERMYFKIAAEGDKSATDNARDALKIEGYQAEPKLPRSGKFLYEDTTPQALVQMLYENTPNGCLLTSEANSIFSGKALGELDKLNILWDGGSVIVDRVTRKSFNLQHARLTLSLMAQPTVITTFMGKRGEEARGTGFLARFIINKPHPMAGQRKQNKMSSLPRKKSFNARIEQRLSSTALGERQVLHFSELATELWYQYSRELEHKMQDNGMYYYLKDHASKLLENTSRMAAVLHTFERDSDSDIEIDNCTLMLCWDFIRVCSKHFIEQLAGEPQIVIDANNLTHYLLKIAKKEDAIFEHNKTPYRKRVADRRHAPQEPPKNYIAGVQTTFTLTKIKQYGPSSLRGRSNTSRLESTIELLIKLGHISKLGGVYTFQETVLSRWIGQEGPPMKNGVFITIKELPLFSEQEPWQPDRTEGFASASGYYLLADR